VVGHHRASTSSSRAVAPARRIGSQVLRTEVEPPVICPPVSGFE